MEVKIRHLTPNPYSRRQDRMQDVRGIALHWVQNPGTSAHFNWVFFEGRKSGKTGEGSAHYIVGLDGEILQVMPENEVAFHAGPTSETLPKAMQKYGPWPNAHLIGIELCHLDWEGRFSYATMQSATELCASLCRKYDLNLPAAITTHNAITGKDCPRWFVNHPEDLTKFRQAVFGLICLAEAQGESGAI